MTWGIPFALYVERRTAMLNQVAHLILVAYVDLRLPPTWLLGRSICHAPWPKVNPIVHPTSYPTHIPIIPSESTLPFLSYSNFNILTGKSQVKVMGEVKVCSHNVSLTFYRLTSLSFHVNQPSHSWDATFSKFDLENSRSRSWKFQRI